MKKSRLLIIALIFTLILSSIMPVGAITTQKSVLYVMDYLKPGSTTTTTLNQLKASGFDTIIVFSTDCSSNGDLTFFGSSFFTNGSYVGASGWPNQIKSLKTGTTSITRVSMCLGGNYANIRTAINTYGTGSTTRLYKNFAALKSLAGIDAIDFDDETLYDSTTMVRLGQMLGAIGYKVSLCPYNNRSVWQSVKSQLGSIVDAVNLQCYDGGAGNVPSQWNPYFGGLKVTPLFWSRHAGGAGDSYTQAQTKVAGWKSSAGITSAGAWQYGDMRTYPSGGTPAQYNTAIRNGLR